MERENTYKDNTFTLYFVLKVSVVNVVLAKPWLLATDNNMKQREGLGK